MQGLLHSLKIKRLFLFFQFVFNIRKFIKILANVSKIISLLPKPGLHVLFAQIQEKLIIPATCLLAFPHRYISVDFVKQLILGQSRNVCFADCLALVFG